MANSGTIILSFFILVWIVGVVCIIISLFVDKEDVSITKYSIPVSHFDENDDVIIIADDYDSTT